MSDIKILPSENETHALLIEPKEENPMLGFRGASRYYSPSYRDGFSLECKAIKFIREKLGLTNVTVMIPFCRTLKEADRVLEVMAEEGLVRSKDFKVYVMCEIPSNVILAKEFAKRFDGFSIGECIDPIQFSTSFIYMFLYQTISSGQLGSNDLTQLTLGIDRDSEQVSHRINLLWTH